MEKTMKDNVIDELESINIAIKRLTDVLEEKSQSVKTEWGRDQMRIITMDLQELTTIRRALLKDLKKISEN